ncbi:hypothetical protein [Litoreibacter janthinus]|nr:hypothetical protein [Litoreibacter janthinus]
MAKLDTSAEMAIGRDWVKSLALIGICVFVCVFFVHAIQSEASGYYQQRAKTGGYLILPLMVPFTLWVVFRLFVPFGPLLRISPDGFADRRVNTRLVPWSEVKNIVARSEFVTLTLSRGFTKSYSMSLGQRLLKWKRKAGPSHLVVAYWFIKPTETNLKDILSAYRAAHINTQTAAAT